MADKMNCENLKRQPPCYVQLGRFGDIMILLPALRHLHETTGVTPVVMACAKFATVLEGCSYVTPWPFEGGDWVNSVRAARDHARRFYDEVVVPKWWDCAGMEPPPPPPDEPNPVTLEHCGRRYRVAPGEWDSYQFSQWKACGFTKQNLLDWPLVFDRRSPEREARLVQYTLNPRLPAVLYNFSGISNQMPFAPEVLSALHPLRNRVQFVDLSVVMAHRIYDLLGLYDRAACVLSGDTATLHLAAASKVPLIALLANGGAGSIPRGNCIASLRYHEVRARVGEIRGAVEKLL